MTDKFLGVLDSSFQDLVSTISNLPNALVNNVGHIATFAVVDYLDDRVFNMFPPFTGSSYVVGGIKSVIQHKIGSTLR